MPPGERSEPALMLPATPLPLVSAETIGRETAAAATYALAAWPRRRAGLTAATGGASNGWCRSAAWCTSPPSRRPWPPSSRPRPPRA